MSITSVATPPTEQFSPGKHPKVSAIALARALGLSGAVAQEWQVRYALLKKLRKVVAEQSLTHAEVAAKGGSSRARVTAILNGNLENVSTNLLIRLLSALGYRVRVTVSRIDSAA